MFSVTDRKEMIAKIRQLPATIEAAVKGLNNHQLDTPYGEGKWTPRQVVHHLADSHLNAFVRMKLIITEEKPTLKTYDQEKWAETGEARKVPVDSSLSILRGLHQRWCDLMESLSEAEWQRKGLHPERGEISLNDLLKIYANHGEKHAGQITKLRSAKGW